MDLKNKEPELRDEVKHKEQQDISGVVIAKYPCRVNGEKLLDIRLPTESIYYATPAKNWEVVRLNDE